MFISKDSIIINGVSMGKYLTEVNFQYPKLWGADSGRNLAGDMVATLIGIFPKIKLSFKKLTKSELEIIASILDSVEQTFVYYDPVKKQNVTLSTYTSDWEVKNKGIIGDSKKNESFEVSFIARRKRQ